jgi:hypothetical protein
MKKLVFGMFIAVLAMGTAFAHGGHHGSSEHGGKGHWNHVTEVCK